MIGEPTTASENVAVGTETVPTPVSLGKVTAVVLAGGEPDDRLAAQNGVEAKALLPIGAHPMGAYVLAALRSAPSVGPVVYVGPVNGALHGLYDVAVPAGIRITESLALGLGAAIARSDAARFLIVTADVPFVDGAVLERFLEQAPTADLVYPAVPESAAQERFPLQRRTYVRLREGRYTGGNAVLVGRAVVPRLLGMLERLFRARKNPVALAALLGPDVVLGLLTGRASVPALERRASSILGAEVRALLTPDAELAADVDSPAHVPGALSERLPSLVALPAWQAGAGGALEGDAS